MIHLFCALPCEAQPLLQGFKLSALKNEHLFNIYQSENKETSLIVTGTGKINMAAAVAYHHAYMNTHSSDIWLNIGIAGHKCLPIGAARLVNKISDEQNPQNWYPQIVFDTSLESESLISLQEPSTAYQNILFDTEASAFYQLASRLGNAELIHCFKIVSDNENQPAKKVTADSVRKLIGTKLSVIKQLIQTLKPLSDEIRTTLVPPKHYDYIVEEWRFSQYEKIQLSRLLRQWQLIFPTDDVSKTIANAKTSRDVLTILRSKINKADFILYD